jgi:hypothetical protein
MPPPARTREGRATVEARALGEDRSTVRRDVHRTAGDRHRELEAARVECEQCPFSVDPCEPGHHARIFRLVAKRGDQQRCSSAQPGSRRVPDPLAGERGMDQRGNPVGMARGGQPLRPPPVRLCPRGGFVADLGQRSQRLTPLAWCGKRVIDRLDLRHEPRCLRDRVATRPSGYRGSSWMVRSSSPSRKPLPEGAQGGRPTARSFAPCEDSGALSEGAPDREPLTRSSDGCAVGQGAPSGKCKRVKIKRSFDAQLDEGNLISGGKQHVA